MLQLINLEFYGCKCSTRRSFIRNATLWNIIITNCPAMDGPSYPRMFFVSSWIGWLHFKWEFEVCDAATSFVQMSRIDSRMLVDTPQLSDLNPKCSQNDTVALGFGTPSIYVAQLHVNGELQPSENVTSSTLILLLQRRLHRGCLGRERSSVTECWWCMQTNRHVNDN